MELTKADAVKLMVALGINSARAWDGEKLQTKLNSLQRDQMEEEFQQPDTEAMLNLSEKVFTALEKGDKIVVKDIEDDDDEEGTVAVAVKEKKPKVAKEPKAKKEKAPKEPKAKKEPKPKKEVVQRDKYGSGFTTNAHKINLVLMGSEKPVTVKEITEKAGVVQSSVPPHLKNLLQKGWAEKVEDGWVGLKTQKDVPKVEKVKKEKVAKEEVVEDEDE